MRAPFIAALVAAPLAFAVSSALAQATPDAEAAQAESVRPENGLSDRHDHIFWCAAAYGVSSVRAGQEGAPDVATALLSYSEALANLGKAELTGGGMPVAESDAVALTYFDEVLAQFQGEGLPRFTPNQCRVLVEPLLEPAEPAPQN